nr:hypothetical protein [Tanacetum cinerariifolium]
MKDYKICDEFLRIKVQYPMEQSVRRSAQQVFYYMPPKRKKKNYRRDVSGKGVQQVSMKMLGAYAIE